jgi:endonuclease/exonuclease/phosphatase family metal-dependent hydrolase
MIAVPSSARGPSRERAGRFQATSWRVIALGLALVAGGCATAHNYRDPGGPRFVGQHAADAPPGSDLHVVTFNIAHAHRIPEAIAILRTQASLRDMDVLALQEMDAPGVQAIAKAMGLNYVYYPASRGPEEERDMGEALLSPWPIEESWKVPLPHDTRVIHRSRVAVGARIRVDGRAVRAYSVHFGSPWGMGGGGRRDQAKAVLADALASPDPVVIAGDFNGKGVSRVFESAGFLWVTRDVGRTVGPFSFDHIVARGLTAAPSRAAGVVREAKGASDHRPVWARLHLRD